LFPIKTKKIKVKITSTFSIVSMQRLISIYMQLLLSWNTKSLLHPLNVSVCRYIRIKEVTTARPGDHWFRGCDMRRVHSVDFVTIQTAHLSLPGTEDLVAHEE